MTLLVAYKSVSFVMYVSQRKAHVQSWVHYVVKSSKIGVNRKFRGPGGKYVGVPNP
jgi:hypothetical protein